MMSLPILSSQFFKQHKPQLGFFTKWRSSFAWNESCLPIYEWQNVLYVGCLRAPEDFQVSATHKVVFVLCEAGALQDLWLDYQNPAASATPSIDEVAQFQFQKPSNYKAQTPIPEAAPTPELPEGFDLDLAQQGTSTVAQDPTTELLADLEPGEASPSEPENETLDLTAGASEIQTSAQTTSLATSQTNSSILRPLNSTSPNEVSDTSDEYSDPNIPKERATPTKSEILLVNETTRLTQALIQLGANSDLETVVQQCFLELAKTFQKSMLLMKKGDVVRVWKTDVNFKSKSEKPQDISLLQPSPFRIVSRTKKPYHGYIIVNDITQKFFDEWNQSEIPDHLSLTPVLVDDQVVGMVLAIGDQNITNDKNTLILSESAAESLGLAIKNRPKTSKAA